MNGLVDGLSPAQRSASMRRMRTVMEERGYTPDRLAEDLTLRGCRVSARTVRRWLQVTNTSAPNIRHMFLFCQLLDMNPSWLLYGWGVMRLSTVRDLGRLAPALELLLDTAAKLTEINEATEGRELSEGNNNTP